MRDAQSIEEYKFNHDIQSQLVLLIEDRPDKLEYPHVLKISWLDTPLGPMVAIADNHALYLLEFIGRRGLVHEVKCLKQKTQSVMTMGSTPLINSIENELSHYFSGKLTAFKTPLFFLGSSFQKQVWEELRKISYGETRSYADIAEAIGRPTAFRAVAQANGSNQLAIIVPCHRVINKNGDLGGYAGGLGHKEWLINHEQKNGYSDMSFTSNPKALCLN
ncbi:MAG: cysteine methyltransferase [Gammaproteobacteria bacterium]|jgi:AraC family transcriptional regulator of adaptative response/methylated-DNA-[protein]-cysteine methyltransferase|nr:cysteine methyltransferase [Gammaproteobacteria bacterium]